MAPMAPSRTSSGVGRSQIPWPRLIPPTRSHSRVMRRISDCSSPCSRVAMRMRVRTLLRPERILQRWTGGEVAQRLDEHVETTLQVGHLDLLVDVVTGVRLSREPHPVGDRVRDAFRIRAAAGDGRRRVLAGGALVIVHQAADDLRVAIEHQRLVAEVDLSGLEPRGEPAHFRVEALLRFRAGERRGPAAGGYPPPPFLSAPAPPLPPHAYPPAPPSPTRRP